MAVPPRRRKAVTYIRVSSKRQDEEGFSPEAQFKILHTYANKADLEIVKEFQETASARKAGRGKFNEMVEFLRNQPVKDAVKVILVEKSDRLSRNVFDAAAVEELRQSYGVEIHYVKEGSVLSKASLPAQKFMGNIHNAVNAFYGDNLSLMVSKGLNEKASQGYHPTKAPLGYINIHRDGQKLIEPDPLRRHHVQRVFELMASGQHSIKSLAKLLAAEGFKTKRGKAISKSHLQDILEKHTYYGMVDYNGKIFPGKHEAIIDQDLFDRAQAVLRGRSTRWKTVRSATWAFQGLLTCGHCGCSVVGEQKTNKKYGGKYVYYHCTGNRGKCPEKYASETRVAEEFGKVVARIQMDEEAVGYLKKALLDSHQDKEAYQKATLDTLGARYKVLGRLIEEGYEDSVSGVITKDFYVRKRAEWRAEQVDIEARIAQLRVADDSYMQAALQVLELCNNAARTYESLALPEKRELLSFVCSNSTWRDGTVTPTFCKPFDAIVQFMESKNAASDPVGAESGILDGWLAD
jgi:site-specific DNA recombinase